MKVEIVVTMDWSHGADPEAVTRIEGEVLAGLAQVATSLESRYLPYGLKRVGVVKRMSE